MEDDVLFIRNIYNSISLAYFLTAILDEPDSKERTRFFIFSIMFIFYACESERNNKLINL